MVQGTIGQIFGVICITLLTIQIGNPGSVGLMTSLGQGGVRSLSAVVDMCVF